MRLKDVRKKKNTKKYLPDDQFDNGLPDFKQYLDSSKISYTTKKNPEEGIIEEVYVKTPNKDVTALFRFISPFEYLYEIDKGNDTIMYEQVSRNIGSYLHDTNVDEMKYLLNPIRYFNRKKQFWEKKLNKARKSKVDRKTGYSSIDHYEVSKCEHNIKKIDNWISKL